MSPEERSQLKTERIEELAIARDRFYIRSMQSGEDAEWALHCFKVTNSFGPHLLTFFEVPGMPSTNNGMEQKFGHIRTKLRRTTGRQNNHDLIYRHGEYISLNLGAETMEELQRRISAVNPADYRKEQARNREKVKPLNIYRRVKQKTKEVLKGLKEKWKAANNSVTKNTT